MVSFFRVWVFGIVLKSKRFLAANPFGGLVVRTEDCRPGTPGWNTPRHFEFFFFFFFFAFKIEETCTFTKFVEQN